MVNPVLAVTRFRDGVEDLCTALPPRVYHSKHHALTVDYYKESRAPWRKLLKLLCNGRKKQLMSGSTKPIHFSSFTWTSGNQYKTITRQTVVDTLAKLADRTEHALGIVLDISTICYLVDEDKDPEAPESLFEATEECLERLRPLFFKRVSLFEAVNCQAEALGDLERKGEIPAKWQEHSRPVTLYSLVPVAKDNGEEKYTLLFGPNSPSDDQHETSDWLFRVIDLLSSDWDRWCNEFDAIPDGLMEEAEDLVCKWKAWYGLHTPCEWWDYTVKAGGDILQYL